MDAAFEEERAQILEMVASGEISPEDAVKLLDALSDDFAGEEGQFDDEQAGDVAEINLDLELDEPAEPAPQSPETNILDSNLNKWRQWWTIPLGIGIFITLIGALLMLQSFQTSGINIWFIFAFLPFFLGVLIMALAWYSRTSPWIHIRVREGHRDGRGKIALSFPLPLHLAAWFVRNFGQWIPYFDNTGLDELILALGDGVTPENPFYVEVNEGENGDRVEVYIG
jgi:polyhydroxyalkanoate synthesis regulator phasin